MSSCYYDVYTYILCIYALILYLYDIYDIYIHIWIRYMRSCYDQYLKAARASGDVKGEQVDNCSVLQCVAECCIVLQCVAVCCSVLQCVAMSRVSR